MTTQAEIKVRTKRACMCCGREFFSAGSHNRLCEQCKRSHSHISPFDPMQGYGALDGVSQRRRKAE